MADESIRYQPGSIEAALANGEALLQANPQAALLQAETLLRKAPGPPAAHWLAARALDRLDRGQEARKARAQALELSRHIPAIAEAHRALTTGRTSDVPRLIAPHLAQQPHDPLALLLLGEALTRTGRVGDAIAALENALALMPEYREAQLALVRAQHHRYDLDAALRALQPLIAAKQGDVMLLRWRASLLSNLGDNATAAEILALLTKAKPDMSELWISLGDELRTLGRSDEAQAAYLSARDAAPALGAAWWSLAALRHTPFAEADRQRMLTMLGQASAPDDRFYLHFALGTAFEQAGMPAEAFENLAAGNAIRHRASPFDPGIVEAEVERSGTLLTAAFFASRAEGGCPNPAPIFIVGMPRSGSTLVEQILASHAQIEGTAELPIIPTLIGITAAEHGLDPDASYRELLPRLAPETLAALGEEYLRLAGQHRKTDKPFFLDKLPHNWADLGFIRLILPKARIIDVRRAPMDCCWSNFRLLFAKGHPASDSLEGIAAYYRHYVAMMAHFDEALPGYVHRVIHEQLVDDFEPELRRMLDYLALPFDPACLDFHANSRSIATASSQQVRRPINREGIGAWRAYEAWLGPLKAAVGDLEQSYAN